MNLIVVAAILLTTPVILVWPHVGILVWFWIGFMNPHRFAWGTVAEISFALIVASITLAAWFLSREQKRFPFTSVTILLAIFSVWITWTTFYALVPEFAWVDWNRSIKILVMTFVTMAIMKSRERVHALVWVTVVSIGFFGFKGGIFTLFYSSEYHVFGPRDSFISDNNQLAMALLMTLPLMRYLQLHSSLRPVRLGLIAAMVLSVFSVIGSQSRGAFLALLVVGAAFVLKSRYRLQIGALALCLALVGVWFVPKHWVERMETIQNYEDDPSAMARIHTWKFGYDIAKLYPLTGGGFNVSTNERLYLSMVPEESRTHSFHSVYFEVLGEHGFIGLAIFLLLGYFTWRTFGTVRKETIEREELRWASDLGAMGQVSLIAYFSAGAFLNLAFFDLYYLIIALAVLTQAVVRKELGNPKQVLPVRQPAAASQTVSVSNDRSTAVTPTHTIR
jgi:probable O-glycosylation ligase (exosortase A-associated)